MGVLEIKEILQMLWFYIAMLCNWIKNLSLLFQPIRLKPKLIVNHLHDDSCMLVVTDLLQDFIGSLDHLCLL